MGDCFKFLWPFQNVQTLTTEFSDSKARTGFFKKLLHYHCTSYQLPISSHQNMVGYLLHHLILMAGIGQLTSGDNKNKAATAVRSLKNE